MAKIAPRTTLHFESVLSMDEEELRALDAVLGYDVEVFLTVFYEKMGTAYLKPHEKGLRSLHEAVKRDVSNALSLIDDLRKRLGMRDS